MRVRARTLAVAALCAAWSLTAAGCVRVGGKEPTPPPIDLPTLATASPTPDSTPRSDDELLAQSKNAIVRIESVDCDQAYATATGFFLQPGFVVTAYHVVRDAQTLAIRTLSTRTGIEHVFTGDIVGHNKRADVALIQVADDDADVLPTADAEPTVNTDVVSIGYPKGLPIGLETGRITGVDQDIVVTEGEDRRPLKAVLRFTAAADAGTSGGPLIDRTGAVVGLVDSAGARGSQVHYAVSGKTVKALADGWAASPEVQQPPDCESSSSGQKITVKSSHPDGPGITNALRAYVDGINAGEQLVDEKHQLSGYELAYAQLSGDRLAAYSTLAEFSDSHRQRISNVVLQSVAYVDDTSDTARVSYDYVTIGAYGSESACRKRSMEYTMSIDTGVWTFADQTVSKRAGC